MRADGNSEWRKNGVIRVSNYNDMESKDLYLKLQGNGYVVSPFYDVLVGYWE